MNRTRRWRSRSRSFTFQITFPTGGFWGVGLKPWEERKRTAFEILPEVQAKVAAIPGIQTFPILPPALPGGGQLPGRVRDRLDRGDLRDPRLRAAAPGEGGDERHVRVPAAHRREDRPARVGDRASTATRWRSWASTSRPSGQDLSAALGGNFVNRFSIGGRSYKVIPQLAARRAAEPGAAEGHLRHRPERPARRALLDRDASRTRSTPRSLNRFQQLNAVKISGVAIRPLDEALGFLEDEAAKILPKGYAIDYTGESRQLRTEGNKFLPGVPARGGADLPGARRAVQQLPRSVRDPRRLGAARHVRRARLHVPQDAEPEHRASSPTAGRRRSTSTRRWGS